LGCGLLETRRWGQNSKEPTEGDLEDLPLSLEDEEEKDFLSRGETGSSSPQAAIPVYIQLNWLTVNQHSNLFYNAHSIDKIEL
jgi:hypothetical protein